jgi:hypothetical protein
MHRQLAERTKTMLDLLIHNATLPDGRTHMGVAVQQRVAPYRTWTCNWWLSRKTACCAPPAGWTT